MSSKIFREYKFKFYLNANHYIIINGKEGETHPDTLGIYGGYPDERRKVYPV